MYNELVGLFEVEVAFKPNIWVKGYVKSIIDESIIVTFDNGLETSKFAFSQCRMPSDHTALSQVTPGLEIELNVDMKDYKGWVPAVVDDVRGEFFTVKKLPSCVDSKPSYVMDEVRSLCRNPPMSVESAPRYHFFSITIPTSLISGVKSSENMDRLKSLCKTSVCLSENEGQLLMISGSRDDVKAVVNVIEFHFRFIQREINISDKIRACKARLTECDQSDCLVERIPISQGHIKYVIGTGGRNINRVRAIEGVIEVRVDDSSKEILIYAKDEQAMSEAKEALEYVSEEYSFEKRIAKSVFGTDNQNIRKVVDRSLVLDLSVSTSDKEIIQLKVSGLRKNVQSAVNMLDFICNSVRKIDTKYDELRAMRNGHNGDA